MPDQSVQKLCDAIIEHDRVKKLIRAVSSVCEPPPLQGRRERTALWAQIQGGVGGASAGWSVASSATADSLSDVERPAAVERWVRLCAFGLGTKALLGLFWFFSVSI